jgi:hypothetical protein
MSGADFKFEESDEEPPRQGYRGRDRPSTGVTPWQALWWVIGLFVMFISHSRPARWPWPSPKLSSGRATSPAAERP